MIKVVGADRLVAKFGAGAIASEVAEKASEDALGHEVLRLAQGAVPVLTGHLRDSLTYETTAYGSRVYTDVVYAGQVEYGGLHNPPEPYMRPAADLADTEVAGAAAKAVIDGV